MFSYKSPGCQFPATESLPGRRRGGRAPWITDRIGAFIATAAVARGASVLVAGDAVSPAAISIARAAQLT